MNNVLKTAAFILALSQIYTTAFAVHIDSAESVYDFDSGEFRIEGSTTYANQPVKLEILKKGVVFDQFDSAEDLLYTEQVYSGDDKLFSFHTAITDTGSFSYRISELAGSDVYASGFSTYTDETVHAAITAYIENSGRTTEELHGLIADYYPVLGVDIALYEKLDGQVKQDMLAGINQTEYPDAEAFKKSVAYIAAQTIVSAAEDVGQKVSYVDAFANQLGIADEQYYADYKVMDSDAKADVITMLSQNAPYATFSENLKNAFVLYKVDNALWNTVCEMMDQYLGCDASGLFSGVSANAQKTAVTALKTAVRSGAVTKAGEMYDYLKEHIPAATDNPSSSNPNHAGGGSGGSFTAPAAEYQPTTVVTQNAENSEISEKYFVDTADVAWAEPAIEYLYKKGVINGKSERIFAPHDSVTREEFVKMIMLAFNFEDADAACSFSDVDSRAWYYPYVSAAYTMHIISGQSPTSFGTGTYIKRQDMAQILYNAASEYGADLDATAELTFADQDEISDYAQKAVSALAAMQCLTGDEKRQCSAA